MSENGVRSQKPWLTIGLVVMLCIVNVLLIKQNLDLRRQLAAGARTLDLATNVLQPGDIVTPVQATDLNGRPYNLQYNKDGRHRLLLYFSPNCPYCQQQTPLWRGLLNHVDGSRFTVVGVVSDREDKESVSAHANGAGYFNTKTPLPVIFFDNESLGTYKLTATPTTLLIDDDGRVEYAWVGKWDDGRVREVAAALK